MSATTAATPPEVELVRSFVNTIDYEDDTERIGSPEALTGWLREQGRIGPRERADAAAFALAHRLRAALRRELEAHHGGTVDRAALAEVDAACAELPLQAVTGGAGLAPRGTGATAALAAVVAAATRSRILGTWERLKICPAEDCAWAFYDTSRNRSRRWCSMDVCGNRSKVRAYRDRARD